LFPNIAKDVFFSTDTYPSRNTIVDLSVNHNAVHEGHNAVHGGHSFDLNTVFNDADHSVDNSSTGLVDAEHLNAHNLGRGTEIAESNEGFGLSSEDIDISDLRERGAKLPSAPWHILNNSPELFVWTVAEYGPCSKSCAGGNYLLRSHPLVLQEQLLVQQFLLITVFTIIIIKRKCIITIHQYSTMQAICFSGSFCDCQK